MRVLQFTLAVFLLSVALQGLALTKKTVCTITINSSDEKMAFQKYLPKDNFDFVELTDNSSVEDKSPSDWLRRSCSLGMTCDILVVSGHFGGRFFGSSGKSLSLEDLEKASCEKSCDGIIKNPKEVFLFGCNTLAGKVKDDRTPEEYRQVLIADGFSNTEASSISAYRYSPFGTSFSDRMARVFSNTPQIYGFSAKAPRGQEIRPHLSGYLSQEKDTYFSRLVNYLNSKDQYAANISLANYLRQTTFTQTSGAVTGSPAVCYLSAPEVSHKDKLSWVLQSLKSENLLSNISDIGRYLKEISENGLQELSADEKFMFKKIQLSDVQKEQLLGFVKIKEIAFVFPQVATLNLMKLMHWISDSQADEHLSSIILGDLSVWTREKKDLIASLNTPVQELRFEQVPGAAWKNKYFIETLPYLKPTDPNIHLALAAALKDLDPNMRQLAAAVLGEIRPTSPNVHLALAAALKDSSPYVRHLAGRVLGDIKPTDPNIHLALVAALRDSYRDVRYQAAWALAGIKPTDSKVHEALVAALNDFNAEVGTQAARVLKAIENPKD